MPLRTSQDSNSNESSKKQDIKDDEEDSKQVATASLETKAECHDNQGVEDSGCEDTFDGAIGA